MGDPVARARRIDVSRRDAVPKIIADIQYLARATTDVEIATSQTVKAVSSP
jgi:hypothetical protein